MGWIWSLSLTIVQLSLTLRTLAAEYLCGNMSEPTELEVLKQRLNEIQAASEALKNDLLLEREVSQELARRNDCLQKDLFGSEERMRSARATVNGLENTIRSISGLLDTENTANGNTQIATSIISTVQNCLEMCQGLQGVLLTRVELAVEAEKAQKAEQAAAAAIREAQEAEEAAKREKSRSETEKQTQEQSTLTFDSSNSGADIKAAVPTTEEEASQEDPAAQSSDGEDISRARSASTAGRPRNMSIGARRNSSIFVRLPDLAGTSLIRKSSDVMNASHVTNMSMNVGSGESDMDLHSTEEPLQTQTHLPTIHSPIAHSGGESHNESFMDETGADFSMDLNVSRFPHNDSMFDSLETSACADVALFEHFIVVGASEQVATEFAHQLQLSYDENSLSTMFKNTFGGFFNANRFGNGSATAGVANTTAAATANSLLNKQKTALLNAGLAKQAALEDVKGEKIVPEVPAKNDRRLSFGRNPPQPATPPTVTSTATPAGSAAPTTATENSTPVRSSGMFGYFMRSPSGTNAGGNPVDPASVSKKTPLHTQKSQELGSIAELNEESQEAPKPKIIVPSRGFIYGDDSSEHGSNSSHASSDLLAAAGENSPLTVPFAPSVSTAGTSGPLKSSLSGSRSNSTAAEGTDSPTRTHNLTDMINMEDASPSHLGPAAWMQGFNITEIDTDPEFEAFGHSKVFSSDPISPMHGYDLETQPSMKDNNALGGTFEPDTTSKIVSSNPGHLPPPVRAAESQKTETQSFYNGMMSSFYSSKAPPVPAVAPLDSPPKLNSHGGSKGFEREGGSTKSTVTDDSDASYFSPSKPHSSHSQNTHTLSSLAVPQTKPHNGPEDVFVRGRVRSTRAEGYGSGSDPSSPQAPRIGRSVSSDGPLAPTLPSVHYVSNPEAAARITTSDKKAGTATTQAEILYRYPYHVEPPPTEVSDFCMPLGGKIAKLADFDSGTMVQEILFGHSHSKRSSRCFIFLLEDKTLGDGEGGDEETGRGTNKLYGVCVLHPRLVKTPIQNTKRKNPLELNKTNQHGNVVDMSQHGSYNGTAGLVAESEYIEFESMVCYAFLTRFPLFDFFFQVIFDLINTERLTRLELAAEHTDSDLLYSRSIYEYLPASVLEEVLARLTKVSPPAYGEKFQFHISPGIKPIESVRTPPPADFSEHYLNSSEWALPTLLSWMPVESIIWAMSLLLGEAKIVVIGHDYGMVSCAVIGLLVLLRPLDWVSPVIPMLPTKLMDFVESPVPILVGITVSSRDQTVTVEGIFNKNSDPSNDGLVLAVLDVSKRELFMDIEDKPLITSLCMPGADSLAKSIKDCLQDRTGTVTINSNTNVRPKPVYTASVAQKLKTRAAHDIMTKHIRQVAAAAVAHQQKLLDRRRLVIEMANRMSHPASPDTRRTSLLERQSSFGSADNDVSDEEEDGMSRKEPAFGHPRTSSAASATSTSSATHNASNNNLGALVATSSAAASTSSPPAAPVTAPAPTAASSMAAAFGKVLRPRGTDIDPNSSDRAKPNNPMAPVAANAAKMVDGVKTALQIPAPGPPSKLVHMSKQPLEGNNTEEFLNRFILTQIFSEHMCRQGMLNKPPPPVPAHPAPPVAPPLPSYSPPSSYAAAVSGHNAHPSTYADIAALHVTVPPTDLSPESVGSNRSNRKSVRLSGQFSPLSDGSGNEAAPSAEVLALRSRIESTPRNNLEMRRRSVDMGFRKNSKGTEHPSEQDDSEDEEEE